MNNKQIYIAPSILSADLLYLGKEIKSVEKAADIIHVDVMDGHFVPNLTFGPDLVKQVRYFTKQKIDVHLMLSQPDKFIAKFLEAGTDYLSFHLEAHVDHEKWLKKIRENDCKAGLVLNPDTPAKKIFSYLPLLDYVLVMTVYPGYGGQNYIEACTKKISELHKFQSSHDFLIEVDGGINFVTGKEAKAAGANILVAGSFIFKNEREYANTIKGLRDV
ncbi:MAG: ribulose-phosphate 3-epimerase [Candidatus Cloacimonetes bacterium]|nr:ribulose-phosphate 3-epimerase [Candidatus Cloacimonadota bacterium]